MIDAHSALPASTTDLRPSPINAALAAVSALVCGLLLSGANEATGESHMAYLVVALGACAFLAWRGPWPRAVFAAVVLAGVVVAAETGNSVALLLATAIATHARGRDDAASSRPRWITAVSVTVATAGLSFAALGHSVEHDTDFVGLIPHFGLQLCVLANAAAVGWRSGSRA